MARPRAIYASVPSGAGEEPAWLSGPGFSVPVLFDQPCSNWPDLNWLGDLAGDNSPTEYGLEIPQYLWADSIVHHPKSGETHTFARRWLAREPFFTATNIPAGEYCAIITHAADDQYEIKLDVNGVILNPLGGNSFLPSPTSWRNVKTFVYRLALPAAAAFTLTSTVTNDPQPDCIFAESNPAMFTWVMQLFNHPLQA